MGLNKHQPRRPFAGRAGDIVYGVDAARKGWLEAGTCSTVFPLRRWKGC